MKKIVLLFLSLFPFAGSFSAVAEDDNSGHLPIGVGKDGPIRPRVPSRYQISYYIEGDQLVIESMCEAYGLVTIEDNVTGALTFKTYAMLYPEYRINVHGLVGTYNLTISLDSYEFTTTITL